VTSLPTLPVTMVGSWPRPKDLLRAQKLKRAGRISEDEFEREADKSVIEILRLQDAAGVDIVTDGEQRRDGFFSFVAEKLDGVQMMTLAEMLEIVENKAAFELILQTLDFTGEIVRNAEPDDLSLVASGLRGVVAHGLTVLTELQSEAGRLDLVVALHDVERFDESDKLA